MRQLLTKKRSRPDDTAAPSGNGSVESCHVANRLVVHYPSAAPFPVLLDPDFPRLPYQGRSHEVKTAVHWGQRKLFLSELQLLTWYAKPGVPYHIVYAGSAPGTHLRALDRLFHSTHTWELVDPGQFDRQVLEPLPNFCLRNEFFTNDVAYGVASARLRHTPHLRLIYDHYVAEKRRTSNVPPPGEVLQKKLRENIGDLDVARSTHDIPSMFEPPIELPAGLGALLHVSMERVPALFISDIRTGSPRLSNFEDHVAENMRAQEAWTHIIQADFALLKFRLPYSSCRTVTARRSTWLRPDGTVDYVNGEVVLPIWTRPTSTEGRLVVRPGAAKRSWTVAEYEDRFYYFNSVLRERVHFNHPLAPHLELDNHFDSAAEVHLWEEYVRRHQPEAPTSPVGIRGAVDRLVAFLSAECHGTFQGAIAARNKIVLDLAAGRVPAAFRGHSADDDNDDEMAAAGDTAVSWEDAAKRLVHAAKQERRRALWLRNVDEGSLSSGGGATAAAARVPPDFPLWRCVMMPQE